MAHRNSNIILPGATAAQYSAAPLPHTNLQRLLVIGLSGNILSREPSLFIKRVAAIHAASICLEL
jgi:hypothetical protein